MNYLCVYPEELTAGVVVLKHSRAEHARKIHAVTIGERYGVVVLSRGRASAIVRQVNDEVVFELEKIEPLSLVRDTTIVVGVCRPQTVRKVLQAAVSFQASRIIFLQSNNSEKSYFTGRPLIDSSLQQRILLEAVEQTGVSMMPEIQLEKRFKPFVEDRLLNPGGRLILADTRSIQMETQMLADDCNYTLVIGPEKGWTEFERQVLVDNGCKPYALGTAQLRVELATVALLSRVRQFDPFG